MATRSKPGSAKAKTGPVRQSVTLPAALASAVRRVAKERHLTMSRALVTLAERGVHAEAEAKRDLAATLERFLSENELARKNEGGKKLIRANSEEPRT